MSVAAASLQRRCGHARANIIPRLFGVPVYMIGSLVDQFIQMRVGMLAVHPLVISAGNVMPQMADDGINKKELPVIVPVMSPRVGGALRDQFKSTRDRMKAPDRAIHRDSL